MQSKKTSSKERILEVKQEDLKQSKKTSSKERRLEVKKEDLK